PSGATYDRHSVPTGRSSDLAMPKSITFGLPGASSTLLGLRSRWITPAPWIAVSATATPTARPCWFAGESGPRLLITAARLGPSRSEEHTSELQSREKLVCRL